VAELGPLGQLTGSHEGQDRLLTHQAAANRDGSRSGAGGARAADSLTRSYVTFLWRKAYALVTALWIEDLSGYRRRKDRYLNEVSAVQKHDYRELQQLRIREDN
jgi:hypothetical protein